VVVIHIFLEMLTMKVQRTVLAAMLIAIGGSNAIAQHSDLELYSDGGQVTVEPRIAEGEFGAALNPAYRAEEPGIESDPAELAMHGETPLPGGALVGFDIAAFTLGGIVKSLFYWDGSGSPDFVSVAVPHEMKVSDETSTFSVQFDGAASLPGFNFAVTANGSGPDPAGLLHSHLLFDLVDTTGMGISSPAAGVYAFATSFRVAGLTDSELVYRVLATGVEEAAHEAAVTYISQSVGIVPEPTSLALAGGSQVLVLVRRRGGFRI
jgi:hypothetical protein